MAKGYAVSAFAALRRDTWVRPFLRSHGVVLAVAVVLSVVASIFASALMFTSGFMISLAASIPFTVLALHIPSIFVRIFGIGKPILQYFERLTSHDWVLRMTSSLRQRLYTEVEWRPAGSSMGRMLGLFAGDLEHLQNLCLRTLFPMIVISIVYVIVVLAFGLLSPVMGLLMLAAVGIAAFAMPFWSLAVNGAREESRRRRTAEMYDQLAEDVFGVVDWGLAGRRDEFMARIAEPYERNYAELRQRNGFERKLAVLRQVVYCIVVVAVLAWASYAFWGVEGNVDGLLATPLAAAVGGIVMHDSVPYAANWIAAFVLCLFPLLDVFTPASDAVLGVAEHKDALDELNDFGEEAASSDGVPCANREMSPCVDLADAIELEDASFAYGDGAFVLDGVSLNIRKGEHVAIIGRSGAGKSTLLALASGALVPASGQVRRSGKVGIIEQFPYVFRKSLRENLLLAKPDATDAELLDALDKVSLSPLVARLPKGLDTLMAEGGATLSGGERHRLALARILLYDCDIVLLDEPYLGLDEATREAVSRTLLDSLSDKTILLVTHDSAHGSAFDRVVRVADGAVVER